MQGERLLPGDVEQLPGIEDHDIARPQQPELPRLDAAAGHFGRGDHHVVVLERGEEVALALPRGPQRQLLAAATRRQEADARLHQAHVGLECRDHSVAVHHELAPAAEYIPLRRGDRRNPAVAQTHRGLLEE
jgi:hypothetical protein